MAQRHDKNTQQYDNKNFLGRDPSDPSLPWHEWHLQAYVIMRARQSGLTVHGDQNGASKSRTSASMAKATGMLAGWPDLCFILPDGPLWIELKLEGGRLSKEQMAIHDIMKLSRCRVHVVKAGCPVECWQRVAEIVGCPL